MPRLVRNPHGLISHAPPWASDEELREMGLEIIHDPDEVQDAEGEEARPEPPREERRSRRR